MSTKSKEKELSLTTSLDKIVDTAYDCNLFDDVYCEAKCYIDYVSKVLKITPKQSVLFAACMEQCDDRRIRIRDIARALSTRVIKVLELLNEEDGLVERRLILRGCDSDGEKHYRVPYDVIEAVKNNRALEEVAKKNLTIDEFFCELESIMEDNTSDHENLNLCIDRLVEENMHLGFCKQLRKYTRHADSDEELLLLIFCNKLVNDDDSMLRKSDWEDFFNKRDAKSLTRDLGEGRSMLIKEDLLEPTGESNILDKSLYRLTQKAKETLLADVMLCSGQKKRKEIIPYDSLTKKSLFYNDTETKQIDQFVSIIKQKNFLHVQKRLEENGMRKGFACLFYGSPGTGKTETAYQLALQTKRDLFVINVSNIKSCWVGESEKNITKAFIDYQDCVKEYIQLGKPAPILLFNEADAVLGIRQEGAVKAVDKMENSIQNIILQEMEKLEGIMIATTNLTQNLDKAFERRFLYKIKFEKPSVKAKKAIWQSMIPSLKKETACKLAEKYDFSGGQIENIARKRTVNVILSGKEPTFEELTSFCNAELINNKTSKIGF